MTKKRIVWISAVVAILILVSGGIFAYQQQKQQQVAKTEAQQKKEEVAAKQASTQAEQELEAAQRAQIVPMPNKPTKPKQNIELGWTNENATTFVTNVAAANKHRVDFPKLTVADSDTLQQMPQLKPYFTDPYWAMTLEPNEKPQQVFLKNNGNHTVTMVLTQGTTTVPKHEYTIDSSTYQVIKDKKIDVASSITTWNGF